MAKVFLPQNLSLFQVIPGVFHVATATQVNTTFPKYRKIARVLLLLPKTRATQYFKLKGSTYHDHFQKTLRSARHSYWINKKFLSSWSSNPRIEKMKMQSLCKQSWQMCGILWDIFLVEKLKRPWMHWTNKKSKL